MPKFTWAKCIGAISAQFAITYLVFNSQPLLSAIPGNLDYLNRLLEEVEPYSDFDSDGEYDYLDSDDDNDGLPDTWELSYGLSTLDAADGVLDDDNDGASNYEEFVASSNPLDFFDCGGSSCTFDTPPVPNSISVPSTDTTSDSIGSIAGSLDVNSRGNVVYSIPLYTPKGVNNFEPSLALTYNSGAGNGLLGVGWSMSGLSAITRCPQTIHQDGSYTAVQLKSSDRFCLDGQRLTVVSGNYGGVGSEYRTEIDDGLRIIAQDAGGGELTFEVWDGKGIKSTYSQKLFPDGEDEILIWARDRDRQVHITGVPGGYTNYIKYDYTIIEETNELRISKINYARGESTPYDVQIKYNYESRPDVSVGFIAGTPQEMSKRLSSIDIEDEGVVVRTYDLTYLDEIATPGNNNSSKLASIQECRGAVCLPATEFTWTDESIDFSVSSTSSTLSGFGGYVEHSPSSTFTPLDHFSSFTTDIDKDSILDLIWIEESSSQFRFRHAEFNGTTLANDTYTSDLYDDIYGWAVTDYDNDGYSDILVVTADNSVETLRLFLNEDQGSGDRGFPSTPVTLIGDLNYTFGASSAERASFVDINGDSLLDIYYNGKFRLQELDTQEVYGPFHFGAESTISQSQIVNRAENLVSSSGTDFMEFHLGFYEVSGIYIDEMRFAGDFNGDGIVDIVIPFYKYECDPNCGQEEFAAIMVLESDGDGTFGSHYGHLLTTDTRFAVNDINRDGYLDLIGTVDDSGSSALNVRFNNGKEFAADAITNSMSVDKFHSFIDYNRDGYPDYVYKASGSTALKVLLWDGANFESVSNAITVANTDYTETYGPAGSFFDVNGDALPDYINFNTGIYLGEDATSGGGANKAYNLIQEIENGLGNKKRIQYSPLTDSNIYIAENDAANLDWGQRVFDYTGSGFVVSKVTNFTPAYDEQSGSIDVNAYQSTSYKYEGLKTQYSRGSLGFHKMSVKNEQTGVIVNSTFLQEFPFTGRLASKETIVPNNTTPISEIDFTYQTIANSTSYDNTPYMIALTEATETKRSAASSSSSADVTIGGVLRAVTTEYEDHDIYGNVGKTTRTTTGDGKTYTVVTENTYSIRDDQRSYMTHRVANSKVTTSATGLPSIIRETDYNYDSSDGQLVSIVREPNSPSFTLTTTFEYDNWLNVIKTTQSGSGVTSRYTRIEYDSNGRFVERTYNSLEQTQSEVVSRNEYGQPTLTSDLGGVLSYAGYGTFGRKYFQGHASGNSAETERRSCTGVSCPAGAVYRELTVSADGGESLVYFDNLARPIRKQVVSFDGELITTDTQYDDSGRVRKVSNPYKPGTTVYWSENLYDVLGRIIEVKDPASNSSTTSFSSHSDGGFVGQKIIATNAEGQTKTTISDARGLAYEVTDDLGGRISYSYDARGNLTSLVSKGTSASPLNIETEIDYDLLGRRVALDDPDQGEWEYEYNVFGELTKQTDALNQSSVMSYDSLGRLISRVDKESDGTTIEGSASWVYRNSGDGIGKLDIESDSVSDFVKVYDYDSLGRIRQTYTAIGENGTDGEYNEYTTYDAYGRVFQQVDATNHGQQFEYNAYGYLEYVKEATDTDTKYYAITEMDAWGNVSEALLGNGLTEHKSYQPDTGLPDRIAVSHPYAGFLQDNSYTFNTIGILTERDRYLESGDSTISETFHYDELNRLTETKLDGITDTSFSYDITGNITSKSDVGSYSYGANGAGPHAVTSAGSNSYTYDDAGNMLTGGGRTVSYNTFRKPVSMTKGGHTTSFEYGPDRSRYKRVDDDGSIEKTTIYVGNVEFINFSTGASETKRYIQDVLVITENVSGVSKRYTHKDSLGSIDVITDGGGSVVAEMSFDAFGKRRNALSFSALTEAQFDALNNYTTRGFTGHEMLDEVGAVHMNGRVYDPHIGRFLSADPIVQDESNVQNLNRYSYVLNNPLSLSDPSGFQYKLPHVIVVSAKRSSFGNYDPFMFETPNLSYGSGSSGESEFDPDYVGGVYYAMSRFDPTNFDDKDTSNSDSTASTNTSSTDSKNSDAPGSNNGASEDSVLAGVSFDAFSKIEENEDMVAEDSFEELISSTVEDITDYLSRVTKAASLSNANRLSEEASLRQARGDENAHARAAFEWGRELNAPITAAALRTIGEVGQFVSYTAENALHSLGVQGDLGLDDRYDTFSSDYWIDSLNDIRLAHAAASGESFEEANSKYNCYCNNPIP